MNNARTAILDHIIAANGSPSTFSDSDHAWAALPRSYTTHGSRTPEEILRLLRDRLEDYDATVTSCAPQNLSTTLNRVLKSTGAQRIGIPPGLDTAILPPDIEFIVDNGMSPSELDQLDAVLTGCTVAIAETGTLVLQSAPGQGRRALTLVPDVFLCIVRTTDVVETVPEAFAKLQPTATLPTTFVSGPSATADIEMTRIKGVHGPRFLHVILVEDRGNDL
jgi:L-lactate dehydrogenase complex protein LldG